MSLIYNRKCLDNIINTGIVTSSVFSAFHFDNPLIPLGIGIIGIVNHFISRTKPIHIKQSLESEHQYSVLMPSFILVRQYQIQPTDIETYYDLQQNYMLIVVVDSLYKVIMIPKQYESDYETQTKYQQFIDIMIQ